MKPLNFLRSIFGFPAVLRATTHRVHMGGHEQRLLTVILTGLGIVRVANRTYFTCGHRTRSIWLTKPADKIRVVGLLYWKTYAIEQSDVVLKQDSIRASVSIKTNVEARIQPQSVRINSSLRIAPQDIDIKKQSIQAKTGCIKTHSPLFTVTKKRSTS